MTTRVLRPVRGRTLRLTRLEPCGDPATAGCVTVVTQCFVSVELQVEYEAGPRYVSKDIWGQLNVADAEPDYPLWASVRVRLADANPDVIELLGGEAPVLIDGEAYGFTGGTARNYGAYALEVWTAALDEGCDSWGYLSVPLVRNGRLDGPLVVENGVTTLEAIGMAFPATSAWGTTPYEANPFGPAFPAGDLYGMVVTTVAPPGPVDFSLCAERLLEGAAFWIDAAASSTA